MHHPTDRMTYTTTFVTPVVEHWLEREITSMKNILSATVYMIKPMVQLRIYVSYI